MNQLTLLNTLWRYGFKTLLIGFFCVSLLIFAFFGLELKRMYSLTIYAAEQINILHSQQSPHFILQELKRANFSYKNSINSANSTNNSHAQFTPSFAIDKSVIYDTQGNIKNQQNYNEYSFIIPDPIIANDTFAINNSHISHTLKLKDNLYITSFNTIKHKYLGQDLFKMLNRLKSTKTTFYLGIILIFLILIALFLLFSWFIVRNVSKKMIISLKKLLDSNLDNEIIEFSQVAQILHSYTDNLYQQNILIQNILNNITSAIFLFEDSEIKLSNKQGTLLLEEHNIDQILAQISLKDATLTHIDLGMRRFAATITATQNQILLVLEDITDKVSMQKQIAWKDVARVIAHEIKNPLAPTKLCAEQMLENINMNDTKKIKYLQTIVSNVDRVNKLINDFANFTKQAQQSINIASFDLNELIKEIIISQQLLYKNIIFNNHSFAIRITADQMQIKQALENLIQNAAQACDDIDKGLIQIYTLVKNNMCYISIVDNGNGLALAADKLLRPYVTTKTYGTGLGLVVVNRIAQAHRGQIRLFKRSKNGAVAVLSLMIN